MKTLFALLFVTLVSGCSSDSLTMTMDEASKAPSVGTLQIKVPEQGENGLTFNGSGTVFVVYGDSSGPEGKLYLFIHLKDDLKSNEVVNVNIPDYEGITVTDIDVTLPIKVNGDTRSIQITLKPVYNYDYRHLKKIKDSRVYQNNEEIPYNYSYDTILIPHLNLKNLHGYLDRDFTYGSGLSSV